MQLIYIFVCSALSVSSLTSQNDEDSRNSGLEPNWKRQTARLEKLRGLTE